MNEGDTFSTANNGDDNIPNSSNSFDQPSAAIMSSPDDQGDIPIISTEGSSNSSKFFGSHGRRSSRRVDKQQTDFLAAQNIASNPNAPQFFRDAAAESATSYVQPSSSSKKKPIIIGVVALVVVAVVGVVVAMAAGVIPSPIEEDQKPKDVRTAFNRYANYFLYGEEKDDDIDGEYENKEYAAQANHGEEEYMDKANELLTDFKTKYDTLKDKLDIGDEGKESVDRFININVFLFKKDLFAQSMSETEDDIFNKYAENGYDSAIKSIKDEYGKYITNDGSFIDTYADMAMKERIDLLEIARIYDETGCWDKGKNVIKCSADNSSTNAELFTKRDQYIKELEELSEASENMINSLLREASEKIWDVERIIK